MKRNRTGSNAEAGHRGTPPRRRVGGVENRLYSKSMLPQVIEDLIFSFLPGPDGYDPLPKWGHWYLPVNYTDTEDWDDVEDVRCYGDF